MKHASAKTVLSLLVLGSTIFSTASAQAQARPNLTGWEMDSPYQKLYRADRYDFFKGTIEDVVEVVPLPGMAVGIALRVRDRDHRLIEVQLGPKAFVDLTAIGLKPGDQVKCMGVFTEIDQRKIFIGAKVKTGEYVQIKLRRTADGVPFWAMTLAELAEFTAEFSLGEDAKAWNPPAFFTTAPNPNYRTERPLRIFDDRTPTAN